MTETVIENEAPTLDYNRLPDYRNHLVEARKKSQEDFDKTILALSGGALGISFAFIRDVIGTDPMVSQHLLLASWVCWGFSMLAVLWSFYTSTRALTRAIQQVDSGEYNIRPGGYATRFTEILNIAGGTLFVMGVGILIWFVSLNLG